MSKSYKTLRNNRHYVTAKLGATVWSWWILPHKFHCKIERTEKKVFLCEGYHCTCIWKT